MAFQKGQSGNPNGRPKGSRNKNTEFYDMVMDNFDAEKVLAALDKLYQLGINGDISALGTFLKYVMPDANKALEAKMRMELSGKIKDDGVDWARIMTDDELKEVKRISDNAQLRDEAMHRNLSVVGSSKLN